MKNFKISIILAIIVFAFFMSITAYAGGPGLEMPKGMTVNEMLQITFTALFMAALGWLEPKIRQLFSRFDEEAEKRIKLIENQRIATRLQDGRANLRNAAEIALKDFVAGLTDEQKKDGKISQEDILKVAGNAVNSFLKAESNSTGDLMKGLGIDLYECAAQEVKDIASRIWDRFRPKNPGEVRPAVN